MIVDTSAMAAILLGEPETEEFSRLLIAASVVRISIVSRLELLMIQQRLARPDAPRQTEALMRVIGMVEEPVSLEQGFLARQAFLDYGKGRHPAALNLGDCFAYALAKSYDEPLLFKGRKFTPTDVKAAR
jgi:ribonuclease VapC